MREENKTPFTYIAQQLDQARGKELGIYGLNILIYGAEKKGIICRNAILSRKKRDGFRWLNPRELKLFSMYVGVPLRKAKDQKVSAKLQMHHSSKSTFLVDSLFYTTFALAFGK